MRVPFSRATVLLGSFSFGDVNYGPRSGVESSLHRREAQERKDPSPLPPGTIPINGTSSTISTTGSITFGECPASEGFQKALQCANFSVPVDWANPNGPKITLGMVRLPASNPTQRVGNLFFNPGGPGIAATDVMDAIVRKVQNFSDVITQRFDVIGLDPRGVGLSAPIICDTATANIVTSRLDLTNQSTVTEMSNANTALANSCRNLTGPVFDKVDTISAAQDMEAVRAALGNEPLNWFGQSYGTQLGAQYAALYPQHVRAMLLDGVLQHSGSTAANILIQMSSTEATLKQFFTRCAADTTCPLNGQDIPAIWANVTAVAEAGGLKAPGCDGTMKTGCLPDVPVENVISGARNLLFYEVSWNKRFGVALQAAAQGNGTFFASSLNTGNAAQDNEGFAFSAIACQDGIEDSGQSLALLQERALLTRSFATLPGFGEYWRTKTGCEGWTPRETNPLRPLNITGLATPAFIVNSFFDPATSMVWAQGMNQEIQNSVMAYRNGSGHTSYFLPGSKDSKAAMDDYLVSLKLPATGTVFQN